jgi:hydroxymethylglutaryl-CoA reductase
MAVMLLNQENLATFERRIEMIAGDARPRWGKLDPARMFRHMRYMLEISLGERQERDMSNIVTRTAVRWLFFHVLTRWPGGLIKAPASYTPTPDGDAEAERALLLEKVRAFTDAAAREPARLAPNPLVGPRSLCYWTRLHGEHLSHHLRQFGV